MARHAGGAWLVRIEDLDPPREVPGASTRQLRTLAAFGLRSDGPIVRQSGRSYAYQAAVERLLATGAAFACACSRGELASTGGIHHACTADTARLRPGQRKLAIRLRVPPGTTVTFQDAFVGQVRQDVHGEVGDFVLRRADGLWAYQLAVVVDDAAQGITQVVRGADLLDSTARQILLQRALGLPTPDYAHLPLVLDPQGRKLSKSIAASPVDPDDPLPALHAAWRALGQDPGVPAGNNDVKAWLGAAVAGFDPARLRAAPAPVGPE